jgi:flavin reductase (DIM6/NTAB) family NADH-FMN oxidoreductase RutF
MSNFKTISTEELQKNPFHLIGKEWMLIAASKGDKTNAMTASWGGVGIMWNKPVAYIAIRQTRYTKEFVDASDKLSLNFFGEKFRKELAYFGKVSGRDEDKIAKTGMKVSVNDGAPVFDDAETVLVCRKLFAQRYDENSFVDKSLLDTYYGKESQHTFYIVEIEKVLVK